MAQRDLDKLAAKGARIAQQRRQQAREAERGAAATHSVMARASTTPLGVFRSYLGGYLAALGTVAFAGYLFMRPLLEGLEQMLAADPRAYAAFQIELAPGTDLEQVATTATGLGGKIEAKVGNGVVTVTHTNIGGTDDGSSAPATNYRALRWFQSAVATLLLPLHERSAIVRITMLSDR